MKKRGAEATSNSRRNSLEFDLRVGITDGSQGGNNRRKPPERQEKSNVYGHIGQTGGREGGRGIITLSQPEGHTQMMDELMLQGGRMRYRSRPHYCCANPTEEYTSA